MKTSVWLIIGGAKHRSIRRRDLLNLMIVDEIGRTVTEDVIKKLFHPKLASDICDIQDQIQRSRVIARRLVDRVIVHDEAA